MVAEASKCAKTANEDAPEEPALKARRLVQTQLPVMNPEDSGADVTRKVTEITRIEGSRGLHHKQHAPNLC